MRKVLLLCLFVSMTASAATAPTLRFTNTTSATIAINTDKGSIYVAPFTTLDLSETFQNYDSVLLSAQLTAWLGTGVFTSATPNPIGDLAQASTQVSPAATVTADSFIATNVTGRYAPSLLGSPTHGGLAEVCSDPGCLTGFFSYNGSDAPPPYSPLILLSVGDTTGQSGAIPDGGFIFYHMPDGGVGIDMLTMNLYTEGWIGGGAVALTIPPYANDAGICAFEIDYQPQAVGLTTPNPVKVSCLDGAGGAEFGSAVSAPYLLSTGVSGTGTFVGPGNAYLCDSVACPSVYVGVSDDASLPDGGFNGAGFEASAYTTQIVGSAVPGSGGFGSLTFDAAVPLLDAGSPPGFQNAFMEVYVPATGVDTTPAFQYLVASTTVINGGLAYTITAYLPDGGSTSPLYKGYTAGNSTQAGTATGSPATDRN